MPNIIARALREAGVAEDAISIIPDEQAAIDAALGMGQPGDLLLVFADALSRSWKQITKFRADGAGDGPAKAVQPPPLPRAEADEPAFELDGLVREERGLVFAPEEDSD